MHVTKELDRELRQYLVNGDYITIYARGIWNGRMRERRAQAPEPEHRPTPHAIPDDTWDHGRF